MNLEEIKQRVANTSDGHWEEDTFAVYNGCGKSDVICKEVVSLEDTEFIAHARQDVPDLIAEVERLQTIESKSAVIIKNLYAHLQEIYKMRYNVSSDNNYKKIMETARQALEESK